MPDLDDVVPPADFTLDPRLARNTWPVDDWAVSSVRLMDDARFPWLVLVPRVPDAHELHGLPAAVRTAVFGEMVRAADALERATGAEKMNVAALGNLVPQLHVHVIARHVADAAWPKPVWDLPGREPWSDGPRRALLARLAAAFC